ncbi:Protein of unknown function [Flavobacteriaceae bacterium MAR_2010_188]|nr:Protein of unknown function [Flavobacteriaceae bacterium MAR_2010_188]
MKKFLAIVSVLLVVFSCDEEVTPLEFKYESIEKKENAVIEVNYPKAYGNEDVSNRINSQVETAIANEMSLSDEIIHNEINIAIDDFSKEFTTFKNDFSESNQKWELLVDSEVIYQSPEIISISLSTYIDTGGAHGNTHVIFLNFDPETGEQFTNENIISDKSAFTELAIKYFKADLATKKNDLDIVDSFYGKDFMLPETIGYSDDGIVILYNTYEIAAYSFGITEYVIPYEEISEYITRH